MLTAQDYFEISQGFAQRGVMGIGKAIYCLRMAAAIEPKHPAVLESLGHVLMESDPAEAEFWLRRSVNLAPDARRRNLLGNALMSLDRIDEAQEHYIKACAAEPRNSAFLKNLGASLLLQNDPKAALKIYEDAVLVNPLDPQARCFAALCMLTLGDWKDGFAAYEARLMMDQALPYNGVPIWQGTEPLDGKTIAVFLDQGAGDGIMMLRYCRMLKTRGAHVVVATREQHHTGELALLCEGVDEVFVYHNISDLDCGEKFAGWDFQVAALSLPHRFGTALAGVPLPAEFRIEGDQIVPGSVGICWKGNPKHIHDRYRSIHDTAQIQLLVAGLRAAGAKRVVSLQWPIDESLPYDLFDESVCTQGWNYTAQMISGLELVITVDTAVAHLAGSIGRQVWLLLHQCCDWRWSPAAGRTFTPWYPSMHLFRGKKLHDWPNVIEEVLATYEGKR